MVSELESAVSGTMHSSSNEVAAEVKSKRGRKPGQKSSKTDAKVKLVSEQRVVHLKSNEVEQNGIKWNNH
jgi:hypothetical protein